MAAQTPLRGIAAALVDRLERASAGFFSGVITADAELARIFSGARLVTVVRNFPLASFGQDYLDDGKTSEAPGKDPVVIYVGVMGEGARSGNGPGNHASWCGKKFPKPAAC